MHLLQILRWGRKQCQYIIMEVYGLDYYKPPFHMTNNITYLIAEISELVGRITVL